MVTGYTVPLEDLNLRHITLVPIIKGSSNELLSLDSFLSEDKVSESLTSQLLLGLDSASTLFEDSISEGLLVSSLLFL